MGRHTRTAALSAGFLALVLAGCGTDQPEADQTDEMVEETPDDEMTDDDDDAMTDDDDAMTQGGTVTVAATSLGEVLVDGDGLTLYMFDSDSEGASTCYDACATTWPPLLADDDPATGGGAADSLGGTVERDDGGTQVTYAGWPLYYFEQDAVPGDVNGQGVNGLWWVLDAEGEPIRE